MMTTDRSAVVADAVNTVSLARDLNHHGNHKAAEAVFLQATAHVGRVLGPYDPGLANILAYTEFLVSHGHEVEATPVRERSKQIRERARLASPDCFATSTPTEEK